MLWNIPRPRHLLLTGTLAASLALTACGDADTADPSTSAPAPSSAAPVTLTSTVVESAPATSTSEAPRVESSGGTNSLQEAIANQAKTLAMKVALTADGVPVVYDSTCTDTQPATPNDPQFPYAARPLQELTWAQVRTMSCNTLPGSTAAPRLSDVLSVTRDRPDISYSINVVTDQGGDAAATTAAIVPVLEEFGVTNRTVVGAAPGRG